LMPILAHIAAQTTSIGWAASACCPSSSDPPGRGGGDGRRPQRRPAQFGVGRSASEYGNFKIDFASRDTRFHEALDIILGLWTTEDFTYHGHYYQVDGLTIAPRPLQQPHPPVHLAVSRTAASVDVAVGRDLPILTSFFTPQDETLGLIRLYGERCAATGRRPGWPICLLPLRLPVAGRRTRWAIPRRPSPGCGFEHVPAHPHPGGRDQREPRALEDGTARQTTQLCRRNW
jgi:alkanesulfonate monooxygenase SsuD/methylene tetrahydromethanopterin reductase-like flavin-dependent oxidoreductase (luciferase family)